MPGPWVSASRVLDEVAASLKQIVSALPASWTTIAQTSVIAAAQDIEADLTGRGYSIAQIDVWRQRQIYNLDIALYWTLTKAGLTADGRTIDKLNRRKELEKLTLIDDAGNIILPASSKDGKDTNNDGIPDTFGGASIGGGRLNQANWRFNQRTEF